MGPRQLRDLVVFPTKDRPEFFSVYHGHVFQYNLKTQKKAPLLSDLDFSPTCIAAKDDFLAVGGQRSQLLVKHLGLDWVGTKTIGGSINNCLAISTAQGGPHVYVGNNDETIKVISVPGMGAVTTIPVGCAVNYLAISPDQTRMACVGDSREVLVFDISGREPYKVISTLKMDDSGFSVAWSPSGSLLATGSQDGTCHVFDTRSAHRLVHLHGSQDTPKGAIRNVKFSPSVGSVDLLAFSEHTCTINLMDTRTWDQQDQIRVSPPDVDVNISGMAWAPDGRSLCVGLENGVLEYKVNLRARYAFPTGSIL